MDGRLHVKGRSALTFPDLGACTDLRSCPKKQSKNTSFDLQGLEVTLLLVISRDAREAMSFATAEL